MRARPLIVFAGLLALVLLAALLYSLLREEPTAAPGSVATSGPTEPSATEPSATEPSATEPPPREAAEPVVLLAAGDIASCDSDGVPREGVQGTAALAERFLEQDDRQTMVAALGDLADDGSEEVFEECYEPTWGAFRDVTRPTIGNHDGADDAEAFFEYWDDLDMPEPGGFYGYELGAWHVFVLHSNCGKAGGCEEGDPQLEWLAQELEDLDTGNILAYWHKPRFSVGKHGEFTAISDAYELLEDAGADIVLSGHDHAYQRWAPLSADGAMDPDAPRQFVVGTGGHPLRPIEDSEDLEREGLEFYQDEEHGLLRLELEACGYRWEFVTVDDEVLDDGRAEDTC